MTSVPVNTFCMCKCVLRGRDGERERGSESESGVRGICSLTAKQKQASVNQECVMRHLLEFAVEYDDTQHIPLYRVSQCLAK
jgi:hypothetical protein